MEPNPPPAYIYKILLPSEISTSSPDSCTALTDLPTVISPTPFDLASGFVHLSSAGQVIDTLRRFFAEVDKILLLRIEYDSIRNQIQWEDVPLEEGTVKFPHLFGEIKKSNVNDLKWVERNGDWVSPDPFLI
ncbi:uncharacterized protein VTP21DRAFT_161 [Calcarisporiella thermophila]|uniref:uncharacterized protein n=1 Tax=Calcarisporiella thermophila TaxID=911321 RepID=UPI003744328B